VLEVGGAPRESEPQATLWNALLPEVAKRLPAKLVPVDAFLGDERFIVTVAGTV
jgi:hypothetical protein